MAWSQEMTDLRDCLARIYPTVEMSRSFVDEAAVVSGFIQFNAAAIVNWHHILTEARRQTKVHSIVQTAYKHYREDGWLRNAVSKDWNALAQSGMPDDGGPVPNYLWVDVPAPNKHFVGRATELGNLIQALLQGGTAAVSTEGQGGVGKTTLAVAVAYSQAVLAHFRDGVLWASLGQSPDSATIQQQWANALSLDLSKEANLARRIHLISSVIADRRVLVVLDDVWDNAHAEFLTLRAPNARHLLTTRKQSVAADFAPHAHPPLKPFNSIEDSLALLRALAPRAVASNQSLARTVAEATGGLPITLATVGAYLAPPERSRFPQLADAAFAAMADPQKRLAEAVQRIGADGKLGLEEVLALSLTEFDDKGKQAFYALGAFAPRPARFDLSAAIAVTDTDMETIALFLDRNLIEEDTSIELAPFAMHQSFSDLARKYQAIDKSDRHRDYYLNLLQTSDKGRDLLRPVFGQVEHAWQLLPDASPLLLSFYLAVKSYLYDNYPLAKQYAWALRTLKWSEQAGNLNIVIDMLLDLGKVSRSQHNLVLARDYLERAITLSEEASNELMAKADALPHFTEYPISDTDIREQLAELHRGANNVIQLAQVGYFIKILYGLEELIMIAKIEEDISAESNYKEKYLTLVNVVCDRMGIEGHERESLNAYGNTFEAATFVELLAKELAWSKEKGKRQYTAAILHRLGAQSLNKDDYVAARDYFERAYSLNDEDGHRRDQADNLYMLGLVALKGGDRGEARHYLNRALALHEELDNRLGMAKDFHLLGTIAIEANEYAAACDYFARSIPLYEQISDLSGMASGFAMLGVALNATGNRDAACKAWLQSANLWRSTDGIERYTTIMTTIKSYGCLPDIADQ